MPVFLSQIPEWKALSSPQRQFVYTHCVHELWISRRVSDSKGVALLVTASVSLVCSQWIGCGAAATAGVAATTSFLLDTAVELVFVARIRDDITAFIEKHASQIQIIA